MPFLAPIGFAMGVGTAATATAAATGVMAASLVGGLVVGAGMTMLTGMMGGGGGGAPSMGAAPAAPSIETAQDATRDEQLDLARRKRAGTTLTSSEGLLSTADTTTKTLLGS